jgi:hypothetical protein
VTPYGNSWTVYCEVHRAHIAFEGFVSLLTHLGFSMRVRGGHHVCSKTGVAERINLQRDGARAKPYQVRQVRSVIVKYRLAGE